MGAVLEENVKKAIAKIEYVKLGKKTTVGLCTLVNGFEIVETSSCVKEETYSQAMGEAIVKERLYHRVFEFLGFKAQDVAAKKGKGKGKTKEVEVSEDEAFNG